MIMAVTSLVWLLYFPMWGGMVFPASTAPSATEEAYYTSEYSEKEKEANMHAAALKVSQKQI